MGDELMQRNGPTPRITVIVVDDDPHARAALSLMLKAPGIELLACCETAREALTAASYQPPQVALIDLHLGTHPREGIDLIRALRTQSPSTLCIVLTASETDDDTLSDAVAVGAHACLRKGYVGGEKLPGIIERAAAGLSELDPELARQLLRRTRGPASPSAPPGSPAHLLTDPERMILQNATLGLDTGEIASTLLLTEASVSRHIRNITDKFQTGAYG
jgi:DNA-binding NarL/FixJ family response regulator